MPVEETCSVPLPSHARLNESACCVFVRLSAGCVCSFAGGGKHVNVAGRALKTQEEGLLYYVFSLRGTLLFYQHYNHVTLSVTSYIGETRIMT